MVDMISIHILSFRIGVTNLSSEFFFYFLHLTNIYKIIFLSFCKQIYFFRHDATPDWAAGGNALEEEESQPAPPASSATNGFLKANLITRNTASLL